MTSYQKKRADFYYVEDEGDGLFTWSKPLSYAIWEAINNGTRQVGYEFYGDKLTDEEYEEYLIEQNL